jgi:hypothetical protein
LPVRFERFSLYDPSEPVVAVPIFLSGTHGLHGSVVLTHVARL